MGYLDKINQKVLDAVEAFERDEDKYHLVGLWPILKKYQDNNNDYVWIHPNYMQYMHNHEFVGLMNRYSGTFYNVVRVFCADDTLYSELDEAFINFYKEEARPNTKEVYFFIPF